ncbi:MAG: MFS transporter, partial [Acidobacteriota bacterium]
MEISSRALRKRPGPSGCPSPFRWRPSARRGSAPGAHHGCEREERWKALPSPSRVRTWSFEILPSCSEETQRGHETEAACAGWSEPMRDARDIRKLWVLLFAAFVDMLGYAMVFPLLPFYAVRLGADALVVGWMVASFSIAQVAASPLWGRFSDRWGRRPGVLISLGGSAVAFLIFGFATAVWLLFASRIAQGASGGTTGVMQAYVSDLVPPEERAKGLGWLSAATNAGVMVGPALGSLSWQLGPEAPG